MASPLGKQFQRFNSDLHMNYNGAKQTPPVNGLTYLAKGAFAKQSKSIPAESRFSAKKGHLAFQRYFDLIKYDETSLEKAASFFRDHMLLEKFHQQLQSGCERLITANSNLFTDQNALITKWEQFSKTKSFESLASVFRNTSKWTPTAADFALMGPEKKSRFESMLELNSDRSYHLEGKGYHNIGHAKEMFYDSYQKLAERNLPRSTCMAGATIAFFHDLIQGMDGFPSQGLNEISTVEFFKFLVSQQDEDDKVKEALSHLANSIIFGAAFLISGLDELRQSANKTIAETSPLEPYTLSSSQDILSFIRKTISDNDVSRTCKQSRREPVIISAELKKIRNQQEEIDGKFEKRIKKSEIASYLFKAHKKALTSRFFQSIRMLPEIKFGAFKADQKDKNLLIKYIKEANLDFDAIKLMMDAIKSDKT